MASIQFDSVELLNTTYNPRFLKHESIPDRLLSTLPLAREDGEIFIAERYGVKLIVIQGVLVGTSQADLESKIDTFKELFSRLEKNLDVDWNGSTRRYVATCTQHNFDRDHYNISFVPWTAEFTVLSGEGKDTSTTTALNAHVVTTTTPGTDSFTMSGSKPAKPVIDLEGSNWPANCRGLEYLNTDTGEKIVITDNTSWFSTDVFRIDCLLKKVQRNAGGSGLADHNFYGTFPQFKIGTNNIQISAGGIVNQTSGESSASTGVAMNTLSTTHRKAQSFSVPYADSTFKGIRLALEKTGSPGNMTVRIETDAGGQPSGTLAHANATFTILAASVTGSPTYVTKFSSSLWSLAANVRYWIVISAAGVDGSNYYSVHYTEHGSYSKGTMKVSTDDGVTYTLNGGITDSVMAFQILYGGESGSSSVKHTVVYTKTYL